MKKQTLLPVKRVKTDMSCIVTEAVEITRKDVDELNKQIISNIKKNEIEREKGYEAIKDKIMH